MKTVKQLKEAHSSRRGMSKTPEAKAFKDARAARKKTEQKPGYMKMKWGSALPTPEELAKGKK